MWRHIASNALTLFVVGLLVLAGLVGWARQQYVGPGPLEKAMCLRVERGSNMTRVSEDLGKAGAVSHAALFRIGANYAKKSGLLKAGSYLIPAHASMSQIVDIVTRGGASTCGTEIVYRIGVNRAEVRVRELDPETTRFADTVSFVPGEGEAPPGYTEARSNGDTRYRVALAEGATTWQIVEELKKADFLTGEVKDLPPEGMLAPDSYEVTAGMSRAELLKEMQSKQAERLATAWANRADGLPLKTPQEALILASIVEKETGVPEERPTVASVFINRLRKGMKLQTDPSVIYGVTGGRGSLGRGLKQSELRKKTPYNTYVIEGLPPTPIANPGLASIEAVMHPAKTDYIFFVADGSGGHAFAATLAEHNANVAKWRALQSQGGGN